MTPTVLVPFPFGAQAEFVHTLGGKVCTNRVWLYNVASVNDQALMDATAQAAADWWVANIMPLLSGDLELVLVRVSDWTDPLSPIVGAVFPNVFGGVASPAQSANVAIRIAFRWPLQLHHRVNSNFLAGIPESVVDVNNVDVTYAVALFDAYVHLIDDVRDWGAPDTWIWVCVSLVDNNALRSEMAFGECIGPTVRMPYVTQQRHRLRA